MLPTAMLTKGVSLRAGSPCDAWASGCDATTMDAAQPSGAVGTRLTRDGTAGVGVLLSGVADSVSRSRTGRAVGVGDGLGSGVGVGTGTVGVGEGGSGVAVGDGLAVGVAGRVVAVGTGETSGV